MMVTYWCLPSDEDSARYFAVIRALAGMMGHRFFNHICRSVRWSTPHPILKKLLPRLTDWSFSHPILRAATNSPNRFLCVSNPQLYS